MDPNEQQQPPPPPSWTGGDAPDKEKMEQVTAPNSCPLQIEMLMNF